MVKMHAPKTRPSDGGFTLLEVLVAVLLAMIGLMGTVAVQQTVLNATRLISDSQTAMRLASQKMEEIEARVTRPVPLPLVDEMAILVTNPLPDEYVDASGAVSPAQTAAARFLRQARVVNRGAGLPYNITVTVGYGFDTGNQKTVRLDVERRKTW